VSTARLHLRLFAEPTRRGDTVLGSTLCAQCPHSPAGCCVAPPRYDWSDLARVVRHGHGAWLRARIAAGELRANEHGLTIHRPARRLSEDRGAPRLARCAFHEGRTGCTIDETQRPATCNYYLCEQALEAADDADGAARAREVHDDLVTDFVRRDEALARRVRERLQGEPGDEPYSESFFAWLEAEDAALLR
jgi:hypothetical protein